MAKKKKSASTETVDKPCKFTSMAADESNARLAVKIDRTGDNGLNLTIADRHLNGAQVDVTITVDAEAKDDVPGQTKKLIPTHIAKIESSAEIKRISVTPNIISFALVFHNDAKLMRELWKFPKHSGRILAVRTGDAGDDEEGDGEPEDPAQGKLGDDAPGGE